MPRTELILRVFVASPGDVAEERAQLEEIVRELNLVWSRDLGIRLDLVRWETHAIPGISTDAQAVINAAIADDYDIFIGIMWQRFGTPTGRGDSGTAEAFERAYQRWKEAPHQVKILFYFKDSPVAPSELDPEQLSQIAAFRKRLGELGTLYRTFTDRDEFASLLRVHLSRQVQEWKHAQDGRVGPATISEDATKVSSLTVHEDEELGLIDLVEIGEEGIERLTEVLLRLANEIGKLGDQVRVRTAELEAVQSPEGQVDWKLAKRISKRAAEDMMYFVKRVEADLPLYSEASKTTFDALTRAATLLPDFDPKNAQELEEMLAGIRTLLNQAAESERSMMEMRNATARLPRIQADFNRAKRRTVAAIDALAAELKTTQNLAEEVEKSIVAVFDFLRPARSSQSGATQQAEAEEQAARERFERHFGEVDMGYATGVENSQIDADLAREYAGTDQPD